MRRALFVIATLTLACDDGGGVDAIPDEDAGPRGGRLDATVLPDAAGPSCATDCDDRNPCTVDRCVGSECVHEPAPAETSCADDDLCDGAEICDAAGACVDGEPVACAGSECVESTCDPATGRCAQSPLEGCCAVDADCAAGPCALGVCDTESGTCGLEPVPECCENDADCSTRDACAASTCDGATNRCVTAPIEGCCADDADCPDLGACVASFCDPDTDRCVEQPLERCCASDDDCVNPACALGVCDVEAGTCGREPIFGCCVDDDDCAPGDACVDDQCAPIPDADGDGAAADRDCDDADPTAFPGADEACDDGVDNDCDGLTDEEDDDCGAEPSIVFAAFQFPVEPVEICAGEATPLVFGRVFAPGLTPGEGAGAVEAELGYGPVGADPAADGWAWRAGEYNGDLGNEFGELNDDEYRAALARVPAGEWELAWRFRLPGIEGEGGAWVYADLPPEGSRDGYASETALRLTVQAECVVDRDGDGVEADADCDDDDPNVFPGNPEVPAGGRCEDGLDNDCDDAVDDADQDCAAMGPAVGFAALQFPIEPVTLCAGEDSPLLFGRVFVAERTPGEGAGEGVEAQVGYGPDGSEPDAAWTWRPAGYNGDLRNGFGDLNDDEYFARLEGVPAGEWDVAWRFRVDGGPWTLGDAPPAGSTDGYAAADSLALTVLADCDRDEDGFTADVDCDDEDPAVNPDAAEQCANAVDDDCDDLIDLDDPDCAEVEDADQDGFAADVDCDDADPAINPDADEICGNGVDENCRDGADEPGCAAPPAAIGFAAIQFPDMPVQSCDAVPTPMLFGRVYVEGRTPGNGPGDGVEAQVGYGPDGSDPAADEGWRWDAGRYNGDLMNDFGELADDEYRGTLVPEVGEWDVAWRFRVDLGPWVYADLGPEGTVNGYAPEDALDLTVVICE